MSMKVFEDVAAGRMTPEQAAELLVARRRGSVWVPLIFWACVVLLALLMLCSPALAFAQETNIIPPAVPPPSTDWLTLVAIGTAYTFAIVAAVRNRVPWFDGWKVPVIAVPLVAAAVALYQVGVADPKLLGKHAVILYVSAYGGTEGLRKLASWALLAWAAFRAGDTIPPPPELQESAAPPVNVPKPARMPSLPVLMTLALVVVAGLGCGAQEQLVKVAEAGRDIAVFAEPCLVAAKEAALAKCDPADQSCPADVDAAFEPMALALDVMHDFWCSLSPTSEGCRK